MSTSTVSATSAAPKKPGGRKKLTLPWIMLIVAGALALVSVVRLISGANDLTSVGQVSGALSSPCRSASPASVVCGPSAPVWSTSASKA